MPGVSVRVAVDGELLVRGDTVAPGELGEDGWLHTGDLGRLDAAGHIWITGRKGHRLNSGGENVDPLEVEGVLEAHQGVLEAAVVGVANEEWGERVVAVVVPRASAHLREADLEAHVRGHLSAAKRPRAFRILGSLPRNANGKVDREGIRGLFR